MRRGMSKLASRTRVITLAAVLAVLATTLGATAILAAPADSTAAAGMRHPAVDNTSRTVDLVISSAANQVVSSATMALGDKNHGCNVTATAEVERTVDTTGVYIFSIGRGGTTSTTSSERRMEFISSADADVIWANAATSQGYDNLSGSQTFNFLARKSSAGTANTTVTNATIHVICANKQL
jgi:hypothetical protein